MKKSPEEKSASFLVFIFGLMLIFFNFPILSIFNSPKLVLGFPSFYVYIFMGWLISILMFYFIVREIKKED